MPRHRTAVLTLSLTLSLPLLVALPAAARSLPERPTIVSLDPEIRCITERAVRVALSPGRHEIQVAGFHEGFHFGRLDFHASGLPVRIFDRASGWTSALILPTAALPSPILRLDLEQGGFVEAFVMPYPDAHGSFNLRVDGWPHDVDLDSAVLDPAAALRLGGPDDDPTLVIDDGFERPLYALVVRQERLQYYLLDRGTTGDLGAGDADTRVWYFYVGDPRPRVWRP
jgi:hypothetical protein